MQERTFYGYAPQALNFDRNTGAVRLVQGFTPGAMRIRFETDGFLAAASARRAGRVVRAYDSLGQVIGEGWLQVKWVHWYATPSGGLNSLSACVLNDEMVGYVPSTLLHDQQNGTGTQAFGTPNHAADLFSDDGAWKDAQSHDPKVTCFGPGTMIATRNGEIPVEWLDTSDAVLTRDDGFQQIQWIGRSHLSPAYFARNTNETLVEFPRGSLGPDCPTHPLTVTGSHHILVRSAQAELMFAAPEVLVPARAWADAGRVSGLSARKTYTVTHILLAGHHVIMAEGAWVESMYAGSAVPRTLASTGAPETGRYSGPDTTFHQTARPCVTAYEGAALVSRLPKPIQANMSCDLMRKSG